MPHTTRGRNGRQECRERGYYHLHRNLNNPLLHNNCQLSIVRSALPLGSSKNCQFEKLAPEGAKL